MAKRSRWQLSRVCIRGRGFNALRRTVFDSWPRFYVAQRNAARSGQVAATKAGRTPKARLAVCLKREIDQPPWQESQATSISAHRGPCFGSIRVSGNWICFPTHRITLRPLTPPPKEKGVAILMALKSQVAALHFAANCTLNGSMAKAPLRRKLHQLTHTVINGHHHHHHPLIFPLYPAFLRRAALCLLFIFLLHCFLHLFPFVVRFFVVFYIAKCNYRGK